MQKDAIYLPVILKVKKKKMRVLNMLRIRSIEPIQINKEIIQSHKCHKWELAAF